MPVAKNQSDTVMDDFGKLDFNVSKQDLFTKVGNKVKSVPSHSTLVRTDTDQPIAVVGSGYGVVQNVDLFSNINKQIKSAMTSAQLKNVTVDNRVSFNGKLCMRDYQFPSIGGKKLADKNADLKFRIVVVNGFGANSLSILTGAIDMFCLNGMMSGEIVGSYSRRHTKNLTVSDVSEKVENAIKAFPQMVEVYNKWSKKKVTDNQVSEYLKDCGFSERMQTKMFERYCIEKQTRSNSIWSLYSALTYFSSHKDDKFAIRETAQDHAAATMLKREKKVLRYIKNERFEKLAA